MEPLGHHIRSRLQDHRVILQSDQQRRMVARVVLEQGRRDGLVAFGLPDTHLHLEALCSARAASGLSQRIESSLKQRLRLPVSFVTYPHEPIRDQQHLVNTLRYILTQHDRHDLELGSVLESTNIPDLLGLRLLGRYTRDNVSRCLPRLRRATILEWLQLPGLEPASDPLSALVDATLSAAALGSLTGRSLQVVAARRAMVEVVGSRLRGPDLARLLGVAERTLYELKHRPVDPELVRAIRLQLGLRQALPAAPSLKAGQLRYPDDLCERLGRFRSQFGRILRKRPDLPGKVGRFPQYLTRSTAETRGPCRKVIPLPQCRRRGHGPVRSTPGIAGANPVGSPAPDHGDALTPRGILFL